MTAILGLTLKMPEKPPLDAGPFIELLSGIREKLMEAKQMPKMPPLDAESLIQLLMSIRYELRQAKQFQLADEIRSKLGELGIALEDTPKGAVWKRQR